MSRVKTFPAALFVALALSAGAAAQPFGSPYGALLRALADDLRGQDSATAVLQRWCDLYGPGDGVRIVAQRAAGADKPLPDAGRAALGPEAAQGVRYRRVRLACAGRVLSEADNWYLPSRLTPDMNTALETTETPFGVVVRPLDFHRRGLTSQMLFEPVPGAQPPPRVLENSAVLSTGSGAPFSYVVETYTGDALVMAGAAAAH